MRFSKRRGMLIVFSLLFTMIVLMLVGSVMILTRQGHFVSQTHASRIAAIYAAEAGVADAIEQLNENNLWAPTEKYVMEMPNKSASYSFQFAALPSTDPGLSVNNLKGALPVDGPLGPKSVAPNTAYLVVNGTAGPSSRELHVVLSATPFKSQRGPFVTSGKIVLKGNVSVTGRENFTDIDPIEAGIHSNLSGSTPDVIVWEKKAGDKLHINGDVTASSISGEAINIKNDIAGIEVDMGLQEHSQPSRRFPRLRINRVVERAITATDPPVPTFTPPTSVGTVTLTGEQKIVGGALTEINGDLVLDNANLYVEGDFRVNGSITGNGSIFVKGDTTFSGASDVRVGSVEHTAVYSSGHVTLEGFNGSDFLAAADLETPLADAELGLAKIQTALEGPPPYGTDANVLRKFLAHEYPPHPVAPPVPDPPVPPDPVDPADPPVDPPPPPPAPEHPDAAELSQLAALLEISEEEVVARSGSFAKMEARIVELKAGSPTSTEERTLDFLDQKMGRINNILADQVTPLGPADWNAYKNHGSVDKNGLLEYIISNPSTSGAELLANEIRSLHFDAIGNSYFKGIIFSGGAIHSTNDVEVFGGLFAHRSSESPEHDLVVPKVPPETGDPDVYLPGDVILNNGCRVTYVQDLVDNPASLLNRNIVVPVSWFTPNLK